MTNFYCIIMLLYLITVDDDMDKNRRGRRSKNDNNGRTYRCEVCGKSYLSYPALYTHTKTKHDKGDLTNNRGRGRPKKDTGITTNLKSFCNPLTTDYFKHSDRTGYTEDSDLIKITEEVIEDLLIVNIPKYKEKIRTIPEKPQEHPLYKAMLEQVTSQMLTELNPEKAKCEEVFAQYLVKIKSLVNNDYLRTLVKFVLLFRENMNLLYSSKGDDREDEGESNKDEEKSDKEADYSSTENAEEAPEVSNEFITEYLDIENMLFGFDKEEAIELTQNFCQWMYDNNYTCSKLTQVVN